jgi:hypothetical protein
MTYREVTNRSKSIVTAAWSEHGLQGAHNAPDQKREAPLPLDENHRSRLLHLDVGLSRSVAGSTAVNGSAEDADESDEIDDIRQRYQKQVTVLGQTRSSSYRSLGHGRTISHPHMGVFALLPRHENQLMLYSQWVEMTQPNLRH